MKAIHSFLVSCLLALALTHVSAASKWQRQLSFPPVNTAQSTSQTTSATITSQSSSVSSTTAESSSTSLPPSTSQSSTTSAAPSTSVTPPPVLSSPESTASQPVLTQPPVVTTDSAGDEVTITVTTPISSSSSSTSASATATKSSDGGGGLGTGSIVGLSVAAGVAVLGIVGFFIWKFTRKRFHAFDDNEAIKWPELNSHSGNPDSHPLPVHSTGRSGFDTGSELSLSRVNSSNYSTQDFSAGSGADPYAVPPLPHLNPNQPYRDDPTASTGYYDPYRGPVPGTLENGGSNNGHEWTGEAIPMTQLGNTGRMSPGPQAAMGRMSPGPNAAYAGDQLYDAGRRSPGPRAAYGGEQLYDAGRRSPGPQVAYSGRMSPGPHGAYDGYAAR